MNYFSKSWPEHIEDAIKNKHYIEAFLCLHMCLESDLIGIIIEATYNKNCEPKYIESGRAYPIKEDEWNKFDFKTAAKVCLFMDIIDDKFFTRLMEFNSSRNKLAHHILKKNIDENFLKKEIENGMKLYYEIGDIDLKLQEQLINAKK